MLLHVTRKYSCMLCVIRRIPSLDRKYRDTLKSNSPQNSVNCCLNFVGALRLCGSPAPWLPGNIPPWSILCMLDLWDTICGANTCITTAVTNLITTYNKTTITTAIISTVIATTIITYSIASMLELCDTICTAITCITTIEAASLRYSEVSFIQTIP